MTDPTSPVTPLEALEAIRPNQWSLTPVSMSGSGRPTHAALIVGGDGVGLNQRAAVILDEDLLTVLASQCLNEIMRIKAAQRAQAAPPGIIVPEMPLPPNLRGAN